MPQSAKLGIHRGAGVSQNAHCSGHVPRVSSITAQYSSLSQLEMDAFEEICSHIGADPAKGYSLQQLSQMYLNKSIPEELQLNLEEDWQKLFASQASKKGFMVL